MYKYDAKVVNDAARDRWDMIIRALSAYDIETALDRPGRHMPCPVHGGKDGFRVFKNVDETGGGICNTCGSFGGGFSLLMWLNQWTFPEALTAVGELLDAGVIPSVQQRPPRQTKAPERTDVKKRLSETWMSTVPITDPKAEVLRHYFDLRGIGLEKWLHMVPDHEKVLRYHPSLTFYSEGELMGRWPALIAMVTHSDGSPVNIHRTYIAQDGSGKAPIDPPRKLMTPFPGKRTPGGAIRLGAVNNGIGQVAEGIETALSVMVARQKPVWSVISDTFMATFQPPEDMHTVIIWADKDRPLPGHETGPGEEAADRLRERVLENGRHVRIFTPGRPIPQDDKSVDWNNILLLDGPEAIGPQARNEKKKGGFFSGLSSVWRVA
jgi:phage/plasmid primase-like uncharacterized protein